MVTLPHVQLNCKRSKSPADVLIISVKTVTMECKKVRVYLLCRMSSKNVRPNMSADVLGLSPLLASPLTMRSVMHSNM